MGTSSSSEGGGNSREAPSRDAATDEQPPENMSYWQMARQGYQELVNAIIRPPRAEYAGEDLGPREFTISTRGFRRTDLQLTNPRGMVLQCSHWEPKERPASELPCVIYLHGNSSCRVEATSILTVALCSGLTVFAFDFSGSGQSGGEWVSLGFFERDDLVSLAFALPRSVADALCSKR